MNPLRLCMIVATLFFASCNNGKKQYTVKELLDKASQNPNLNAGAGNYSIDAPAGWRKSDTSINTIHVTFIFGPSDDNGFRENMNVVSESMQGLSVDDYFDRTAASMGNYLQNFSVGSKGEKNIDGIHGKWMQYVQRINGFDLDAILYIIPSNGVAYLITCSALKGRLDSYKAKFDQAVQTFHIN